MGAPLVEGQMMHEARATVLNQEAREFIGETVKDVNAEMQHEVVKRTPRTLRDRPEGPMTKDTKQRLECEVHERE